MYKIKIKKGEQVIDSLEKWEKFGGPMKDEHWKDGRSAKELARYILNGEGEFPGEVENILSQIGCSQEKVFIGEPEKNTSLEGSGGGRHHDLFFVQDNEIVIGIEGKSDETFGDLLLKELSKKDITLNKLNRVITLYKDIYGDEPLNILNMRYQLLTGVSGVLAEAQRRNIPKALFLVITLKEKGSFEQKKVDSNKKDFDNFIESIQEFNKGYTELGPYRVSNYQDIDLYIGYIEIEINRGGSSMNNIMQDL